MCTPNNLKQNTVLLELAFILQLTLTLQHRLNVLASYIQLQCAVEVLLWNP